MRYLLFVITVFFLGLGINTTLAQSDIDSFDIQVTVSDTDTGPPTTPVLLSVVPVIYNQIDLTWSSSTDDHEVGGYNVLRDGIAVATTTLLSYSDTDLTASTTYAYEVRAFDIFNKYSSSSNSISTTTPDAPPPSARNSSEGTIARVMLDELVIDTGVSTTTFNINTRETSRIEIRWGRSSAYELGYVIEGVYKKEHNFLLTDLEPGAKYQYEVIGYTPHGNSFVLKEGSFVTEIEKAYLLPSNVRFFSAVRDGYDVDLSWEMPLDTEVKYVRVVRSHLGFPEYPADGAITYQGLKTSFVEEDVLNLYSPVYYTAFVYDMNGNVSSGAVAIVYAESNIVNVNKDKGDETKEIITTPAIIDEATTTINQERVTPDMKMPQAYEISIIQGEKTFTFEDTPVYLTNTLPFTISLSKNSVAGNLKSIIATVIDPTDTRESYSYLLRINKDQSAYEAIIPSFSVLGKSQIKLEIYDYEVFVVGSYQTPVEFISPPGEAFYFGEPIEKLIFECLFWIILLIIVILLVWFLRRRFHEDK